MENPPLHKAFSLFCISIVAFISTIVGLLSYIGYPNAEIYFWSRVPIESDEGKLAWVLGSIICFIISIVLIALESKKRNLTK